MAERFNTLYSLSDNLYLEGFPYVISAGKLLFDTQTGKALVQLKIKNLSGKDLTALKIRINCFDVAKHELGNVEFTYLDLTAAPNTEFGQKTPVYLPYSETRSFEVNFVEAVYSDGEVLTAPAGSLCAIPAPQSILVFGKELAEEYEIIHGEKCKFIPQKYNSLWVCSCGTINSNKNDTCHSCNCSFESLSSDANKETLAEKRKARLDAEEEARKEKNYEDACKSIGLSEKIRLFESISGYKDADELADKARNEKAEETKRNKKIATIIIPIACVLIVFLILWINVLQPNMKYNAALDLMKAEKYEEAIAAFEAMGGYKDSAKKIAECETGILDNKYDDALDLMKAEKYEEAKSAFKAMDGYKDSIAKIKECTTAILDNKYNAALALMEVGKYDEAIEAFEAISSYKDSSTQKRICISLIANMYEANGQHKEAIEQYEKIYDIDSIYRTMYTYVINNKNNTDVQTYEYLKELCKANYQDAVSIYKSLYKMSVIFFVNINSYDHSEKLTTLHWKSGIWSNDLAYHYKILGGPPIERLPVDIIVETRNRSEKEYHRENIDYVSLYLDGEFHSQTLYFDDRFYYEQKTTIYDKYTKEQLAQSVLYNTAR